MSPRMPRITAAELLRALRRDGWLQVRQSGSHITLKHPVKSGTVTVPKHAHIILKLKTLAMILDQAELTIEALKDLL